MWPLHSAVRYRDQPSNVALDLSRALLMAAAPPLLLREPLQLNLGVRPHPEHLEPLQACCGPMVSRPRGQMERIGDGTMFAARYGHYVWQRCCSSLRSSRVHVPAQMPGPCRGSRSSPRLAGWLPAPLRSSYSGTQHLVCTPHLLSRIPPFRCAKRRMRTMTFSTMRSNVSLHQTGDPTKLASLAICEFARR